MLFEFFSKASFCVRVILPFLDSIIIAFQKDQALWKNYSRECCKLLLKLLKE